MKAQIITIASVLVLAASAQHDHHHHHHGSTDPEPETQPVASHVNHASHASHSPNELQMMSMDMMWMYFWGSDKGKYEMNFLFNNLKSHNGGQFLLGLICSFLFCIVFEVL